MRVRIRLYKGILRRFLSEALPTGCRERFGFERGVWVWRVGEKNRVLTKDFFFAFRFVVYFWYEIFESAVGSFFCGDVVHASVLCVGANASSCGDG